MFRRTHLKVGPLVAWPVAWAGYMLRGIRIWDVRVAKAACHLPAIPTRVLIYREDKLVPPKRSLTVARAAGWTDNIQWVRGLGHAFSFENDPVVYVRGLRAFLCEQVAMDGTPSSFDVRGGLDDDVECKEASKQATEVPMGVEKGSESVGARKRRGYLQSGLLDELARGVERIEVQVRSIEDT